MKNNNFGKLIIFILIIIVYSFLMSLFLKYNLSFVEYCGIGIIIAIPFLVLIRYIEKR